jgi:hypothetical protein
MDGGSRLNILYFATFNAMGIDRDHLRLTGGSFHDVVVGRQATPLGGINLPLTFGVLPNFRTKTLAFYVDGLCETKSSLMGFSGLDDNPIKGLTSVFSVE